MIINLLLPIFGKMGRWRGVVQSTKSVTEGSLTDDRECFDDSK
jgi:hypothetical protein